MQATIAIYRMEHRNMLAQELALTHDEKQAMYDALKLNRAAGESLLQIRLLSRQLLDAHSRRGRACAVQGALHDVSRDRAVPMTWR